MSWETDNPPLFYRWKYYINEKDADDKSKHVFLNDWQKNNFIERRFPPGNPLDQNKITVVLIVRNSKGGFVETKQKITVNPVEINDENLKQIMEYLFFSTTIEDYD